MEQHQILQLTRRTTLHTTAFSALPDAPVVVPAQRASTVLRARSSASGLLHRLGDRLAPASPDAACVPGT